MSAHWRAGAVAVATVAIGRLLLEGLIKVWTCGAVKVNVQPRLSGWLSNPDSRLFELDHLQLFIITSTAEWQQTLAVINYRFITHEVVLVHYIHPHYSTKKTRSSSRAASSERRWYPVSLALNRTPVYIYRRWPPIQVLTGPTVEQLRWWTRPSQRIN